MKYTTFIFDFDYTLADATTAIVECVNYTLEQAGLRPKSCDDIRKVVGIALRDMLFELTGVVDDKILDQLVSDFIFMADKVMKEKTVLYDDTVDTLLKLKNSGHNTAIVTNKFHYRIIEVLEKFDITELVDYIVGSEDVKVPKPSPEGLLKAIDFFREDKSLVLYIGDSHIDANTAASASVDFAAVLTGTTIMEEFLKLPHIYIAKNLTELIQNLD
jgi:phosphoglycolate phosphatase